jgi:alkanesulfonate monooxygenase SsuD/methylene tetrahydromethanopterin reductase-like flavin-dependent oxidoreductase (luciferase family)
MRIGIAIDSHGRASSLQRPVHSWESIKDQALAAEAVGFDAVLIADHFLYHSDNGNVGCWESVALAGALAAATTSIEIGHSVFNAPYRSPALVAKIAESLDEISGGRYILGIGAGNTSDSEYAAFGIQADNRYSRFAEAIEIIHSLLKSGHVDFEGKYWSARDADLVLRGPRPQGPPIVIAAWGPKMMRLTARFADVWNGWVPAGPSVTAFRPMVKKLEQACEQAGRDPATLRRSLDIQVDPLGYYEELSPGGSGKPIAGTSEEIAKAILAFKEIAVGEVRCYAVSKDTAEAKLKTIESMAEIVNLVHAG